MSKLVDIHITHGFCSQFFTSFITFSNSQLVNRYVEASGMHISHAFLE